MCWSTTPMCRPPTIKAAGCEPVADLDAALPRADFVTIHCPKTPETVGMFNAARLARMKPTAYLVNTARGGIIDEPALHAALTAGKLAGAGLDVFEQEPTPADNPLLKLPNVISAPHMAGVTRESLDRMGLQTARNILSVLDGKPIRENVINKEVLETNAAGCWAVYEPQAPSGTNTWPENSQRAVLTKAASRTSVLPPCSSTVIETGLAPVGCSTSISLMRPGRDLGKARAPGSPAAGRRSRR